MLPSSSHDCFHPGGTKARSRSLKIKSILFISGVNIAAVAVGISHNVFRLLFPLDIENKITILDSDYCIFYKFVKCSLMLSIFAFELEMEVMVSSHGVMRLVLRNEDLLGGTEGEVVIL